MISLARIMYCFQLYNYRITGLFRILYFSYFDFTRQQEQALGPLIHNDTMDTMEIQPSVSQFRFWRILFLSRSNSNLILFSFWVGYSSFITPTWPSRLHFIPVCITASFSALAPKKQLPFPPSAIASCPYTILGLLCDRNSFATLIFC